VKEKRKKTSDQELQKYKNEK